MPTTRYLPELTRNEMLELLKAERVGRLGLNDEPQPYVVPTDFAFSGGHIYIHSPAEGRKTALARKCPNVCFEVDRYNDDVTEYRSVIVRGDITEVFDEAEKRTALRIMAEKAARTAARRPHGNGNNLGPIIIFKIAIKEMSGVKSPNGGHP